MGGNRVTGAHTDQDLAAEGLQVGADPAAQTQRAFLTLLYSKYRSALYRFVYGIVPSRDSAADIVQETYCRVVRQAQVVQFEHSAKNYLFATAANVARDYLRRQRHRTHESLEAASELPAPTDDGQPEASFALQQTLHNLREALDSLPTLTRDVFVLSRLRDQSHAEIAARLGVSVRTVERKLSEALARLAVRLRMSP